VCNTYHAIPIFSPRETRAATWRKRDVKDKIRVACQRENNKRNAEKEKKMEEEREDTVR